jgi:hypothetical protein
MLHLNTINDSTHQALISPQAKDYLRQFFLVGGTNLSLRYGHRSSIDLDLFSTAVFDPVQLSDLLQEENDFEYRSNNKYKLFGYVNNIKVDFVRHPLEIIDNIRLFSVDDVSA